MFSSREKGQSLLEVIIVIAVAILVVGALVFAAIFSLRNAQIAKNQAQATKLAQEGIEKVRTGRDRNSTVLIPGAVNSWNGNPSGAIWEYPIYSGCGSAGDCYFKLNATSSDLIWVASSTTFPESAAEPVPPPPEKMLFKRIIILSDEPLNFDKEKKVTAVVQWTDFAGPHESRLITVLRKL
ncbi:hypothetical protein HY387_00835 [Candidatus Daviesbacteria bacterium]|nr:hypothetical protein [Candidatus Daviesbacteria bacterium]